MIETFDTMRPPSSAELAEIHENAMKATAKGVPEPGAVAAVLPTLEREALLNAYRAQDPANEGALRAQACSAAGLFSYGLCDSHGYLTAFGMKVRRCLEASPT